MTQQTKAEVTFSADDDALSNSLRRQVQGNEDWAKSFRKVAEAALECGRQTKETLDEQSKTIDDLKKKLHEAKESSEGIGEGFKGAMESFGQLRNLVIGNEIVKMGQEAYEAWNKVREGWVKSREELEKMTLDLQTINMLSDKSREEFVKEHINPIADAAAVDQGVAAKSYIAAQRLGVGEGERDKVVEATLRNARGGLISPEQMPEFTEAVVKSLRQQGKELTGANALSEAEMLSNVTAKFGAGALPGATKIGETAATAHLDRAEMMGEYSLLAQETSPEQAAQALSQLPSKLLHLNPEFMKKMGRGGDALQSQIKEQLGKGSIAGALSQLDRSLKDAVKAGSMTEEEATEAKADLFGGRAFARGAGRLLERQGELGKASGELLDTGAAEKRAAASYDNEATIDQRQRAERRAFEAEKAELTKKNNQIIEERNMLQDKTESGLPEYLANRLSRAGSATGRFFRELGGGQVDLQKEYEEEANRLKEHPELRGTDAGASLEESERIWDALQKRRGPGAAVTPGRALAAPTVPTTVAIPGIGQETDESRAQRNLDAAQLKKTQDEVRFMRAHPSAQGVHQLPFQEQKQLREDEKNIKTQEAILKELQLLNKNLKAEKGRTGNR